MLGGERLDFELKPAVPGHVKANARGARGLSLRVFSRIASKGDVSVLSIRGGAEEMRFARQARLKKYLPDSSEAIAAWCDLVRRLGGELDVQKPEQVLVRLNGQAFNERKTEFAKCLAALSVTVPTTRSGAAERR